MSTERIKYLDGGTQVSFELGGGLPIFREEYHSPQVGTVVLKGLFNQSAHIELLDGTRYRTLSVRKDNRYPTDIVYPVVHMPGKTELCLLRSPLHYEKGSVPRLRFTTEFDGQGYVFKQITAGQRGFELWDRLEMNKLVDRTASPKLIRDLVIVEPVPAFFALLFPWFDSQTIMYRR
jgi:hypothetical protein